ncbi:MAG: hypothetical protein CMO98_06635 [Woeseia sp.]|nr:hypothetical protein [Woeseia sp.]
MRQYRRSCELNRDPAVLKARFLIKRYILVGFCVFITVLILSFPAKIAYRWFIPESVLLGHISGTIWKGNALQGMVGKAYIRDISWNFKPSDILRGRLTFNTASKPASGSIYSDVSLGYNGTLILSDLSGNVPLDVVHLIFKRNGIRADLSFNFDQIAIANEFPVTVAGTMQIGNLYIPDLSAGVLGNLSVNFVTERDAIKADFQDLSGVLQVIGTLSILKNGNYSLVGQVAARRGATPSIGQQLRLLGSPNENGLREFRFEGQL